MIGFASSEYVEISYVFFPTFQFACCKSVVYVIVIAQVPGIYGSKQTESKGVDRGRARGLFTKAINPWPPVL